MTRIRIANGRVLDPANRLDDVQDLYIVAGAIVGIGEAPGNFICEREIDAKGKIVCPGLVDLSARLREPGLEHKATIHSEVRAAVRAGITTLCTPPDTDPIVDTPAVAELIHQRAAQAGSARVEVLGAMTKGLAGQQLAEMGILDEAGCVGVSNGTRAIVNTQVMRRALEYAATFGLTAFLHPEDPWLASQGIVHEGIVSTRLGLPGLPETAETILVARDLLLVEETGARVHFCRLSTARAVNMVREAQERGLPVTADVTAHHLHLTEIDTADFNSQCHVRPPLRTERDREGLRHGVRAGSIAAICSDHQPHERDARLGPFAETAPGISALETLLPLTLRLVDEGVMGLTSALARLTVGPAKVLGLDRGTLGLGAKADVCVFDPQARWTLSEAQLISRGRNTPFEGWELRGLVTETLVGGEVVYSSSAWADRPRH
ncbi:MAG: dihydroorotase [Gammaproteobacteria bacterium]